MKKSKNYGTHLSEETKQKISNTVHNQVWINNGEHCKRIPKELLCEYLEKGYVLGRLSFKKGSTTIES